MDDDAGNRDRQVQLFVSEEKRGGVWANFATVSHSPYEFTIDFGRLEFTDGKPTGGVVVARVSVAPLFITQLIDALQENWTRYAERALPQEFKDPGAG
jgi:hypothetical protein